MKHKVLCTAPFMKFPSVMKNFHDVFDGDIIEYMTYEEVLKNIHQYNGMIPNARIKVDNYIIDNATNLKALYQPSMGYEHIDYKYLEKKSISFNSLGLDHEFKETLWSTAEHTISLILSLLKSNYQSMYDVKNYGKWDNRIYHINDLRNLNIGIIGFGNIGKKVGYLCNCFGAKVAAYDPYLKDKDFPHYVNRKFSIESLLKNADMVTLHVPSNDETLNLIGKYEINMMRDDSYLINTARGGIVDELALIDSLNSKKLLGAAVDVLDGESPFGVKEQRLVKYSKNHENVIITPHLGGSSYPYMESIFLHSIQKLKTMLDN